MKTRREANKILFKVKTFLNTKGVFSIVITIIIALLLLPMVINYWISSDLEDKRFEDPADVREDRVVIVFGAGLWDGKPSPILAERVNTAVELYDLGKVEKIIMSGDNRTTSHDEPGAMIEMAKQRGVPEIILQPDYAGRRTYDTCYRAKYIFKLDTVILVTQDFHMNRALYLCNSLGVDSVGVIAKTEGYETKLGDRIRDYYALVKAVWEVNVSKPDNVVLGDTIEI